MKNPELGRITKTAIVVNILHLRNGKEPSNLSQDAQLEKAEQMAQAERDQT